jgi:CHAD domain-containing protein
MLSHDPGTRLGSDPEDLHQLRVATRRLRAFLRSARPLLDDSPTEQLRAELAWLGGVLGPARDLDVLVERFSSELPELGVYADAARGLVTALGERRGLARAALLDVLASTRYFALLDACAAFADDPPAGQGKTTLAAIWWAEAKRLRRAVEALGDDPSDDALHKVRIGVKRARYAAELAEHELGKRGAKFVARAKTAQDVLGAHQDGFVAEAEIRAWANGNAELQVGADALVERERQRRSEARSAWPTAWQRLEKAARRARP